MMDDWDFSFGGDVGVCKSERGSLEDGEELRCFSYVLSYDVIG